jgi:dephospho-CoA kinase
MLAAAGIATIDADQIGHTILESGGPAFAEVAARWPQAFRDGEIDRRTLASVVFADREELAALESITHPHIFDRIKAQVEEVDGLVVVEVPVLNSRLGDGWRRIVVDCRDEIRLQRAIDRGMDEDDARSRLASQPQRQEWLAAADVVLPNHGSLRHLDVTVSRFIKHLSHQ